MFAAFLSNVLEAYRAPRVSARRLLSRKPTLLDAFWMLALAFAVSQLLTVAMGGAPGNVTAEGRIWSHVAALIMLVLGFAMTSLMAQFIGARFGGKGSLRDIAVLIAWHALATQALSPVMVMGLQDMNSGGGIMALLLLGALAVSMWMFASFVAEAHGFKRVGPVIGVTLAVSMGVMLLFAALLAGTIDTGAPVR